MTPCVPHPPRDAQAAPPVALPSPSPTQRHAALCTRPADGYLGKENIARAMATFHEEHPRVALELRVRRHPFSFIGDQDQTRDDYGLKREGTWKERLLDYFGGDAERRDQVRALPATSPRAPATSRDLP